MLPKIKLILALFFVSFSFVAVPYASAQIFKSPDRELVSKAKEIVADSVFARIKDNKANELAHWMVDEVHTDASGNSRSQQLNSFIAQFNMVVDDSPGSPFGNIDGFELLQEAALPGTERYFRLTYISYHSRAPLLWEFHFYVTHDNELSINFFNFTSQNPFEYMTTPDMFILDYYN